MQLGYSLAFLDKQFELVLIFFLIFVILALGCGLLVLLYSEHIDRIYLGDALVRAPWHGEYLVGEAVAEEDGLKVHAARLVRLHILWLDRYSTFAIHLC